MNYISSPNSLINYITNRQSPQFFPNYISHITFSLCNVLYDLISDVCFMVVLLLSCGDLMIRDLSIYNN